MCTMVPRWSLTTARLAHPLATLIFTWFVGLLFFFKGGALEAPFVSALDWIPDFGLWIVDFFKPILHFGFWSVIRSGHHSSKAVNMYDKTTISQKLAQTGL